MAATSTINYYTQAMNLNDRQSIICSLLTAFAPAALQRLLVFSTMMGIASAGVAQIEFEPDIEIVIDNSSQPDPETQLDMAQEPTEEELAAARARAIEISRQLDLRTQAIENLQSELGVYAPQLQELYSDLAGFYLEIEDYENAVKLYNDALQVARINTGLYSEEQLPIIHALMQNQSLAQSWDAVDRLHELEYFVASRTFALGDDSYLQTIQKYGQWKLRVVKENILDQSSSALMDTATELSNFYAVALEKIESQSDVESASLRQIITGKTDADLVLARAIARTPAAAFNGTASAYVTETRCQNRVNSQGQSVRQCVNVQVENPRYRQSQQDAKNMELRRYTREIDLSVERLREIRYSSTSLSEADKLELDSQIATLETESIQLQRSERRIFGF
ncbi:MAG: tetratricopeptide (TPR) repeat protein [Pseudohongiellaceae bacterium]